MVRAPCSGTSTKATRGMSIALRLGGAGESMLGSDLLGLYLDRINWREATLQGFRGGAWQHLLDVAAYSESTMRRSGTTVVPTASRRQWSAFDGNAMRSQSSSLIE